ncbi:hypothetical protein [Edwardsiella piscicida]|uniref:hypothetical protein n=1 Tax=Edwardsiella piscicida TaxID=1263550 RepID=UPI0015E822D6|nr:hypothetical protein [Edwardsiella piscicida]UCQ43000.1 hypothetical protein DCF39_09340 [Edwardsiella piscicida]
MMKLSKKIPIYVAAFLSPWFVFFCGGGEFFTDQSGLTASMSVLMVVITYAIISIEEM